MFSPYPNKQRGQAFSPTSSASSPVAPFTTGLSRHSLPHTAAVQQHDSKIVEPAATPLAASTSKASSVSRSAPRKARPLFDPQWHPNTSYVLIPDTTSITPGWAVRWMKYTYSSAATSPATHTSVDSPAQDMRDDVHTPAKRQKLSSPNTEMDSCHYSTPAAWLRACASAANTDAIGLGCLSDAIEKARQKIQSTIDDMRNDQRREAALEEDPFSLGTMDFEDGEVGELNIAAASTSSESQHPSPVITVNSQRSTSASFPGLGPRICLVQTQQQDDAVLRSLWVFELDERRCSMYPLPENYDGLDLADSGSISFASLFPSLVDRSSGYPITLTASNAPSSLDFLRTDPNTPLNQAYSAFTSAVQQEIALYLGEHHGLNNVEVRRCAQDLLFFPSAEQRTLSSQPPATGLAFTSVISAAWEGLVLRSLQQQVPWTLPAQDQEIPPGSKLRLCPLGLECTFKRRFACEAQDEALDARDKQLIDSTKACFQKDAPRLVQDLPLRSWVLANWQDQEILWPLDLILLKTEPTPTETNPSDIPPKEEEPISVSIDDIAVGSGLYVDGLVKDREEQRVKLAQAAANTPKDAASPAPATPPIHIQNSDTNQTPSKSELKSPHAPSSKNTPAAQPPTSAAPQPLMDLDKLVPNAQSNGTSAGDASMTFNSKPAIKSEQPPAWDAFGEDNDHDGGAFDDVLTGLTADDFSFFDAPSLNRTETNNLPSSNIFNIFDNNNSMGSDNLFGDASSGFFAPSPQPNFSHSPASLPAGQGVDHPTPDLSALLPKSGSERINGQIHSSEVSDQTTASPNFSTLFGPSPAAANSPYKTPFTPFSTEDQSPPAPTASMPLNTVPLPLSTNTTTTPFATPQPSWRPANSERFGPLSFSATFSSPARSSLDSSPLAEDVENRHPLSKKARRRRKFFTPAPWKTDVQALLSRSRLGPAVVPLKHLLSADADDSGSEAEDVVPSSYPSHLNADVQERRRREATVPLILGVHLLALHQCPSTALALPEPPIKPVPNHSSMTCRLAQTLLECPHIRSHRALETSRLSSSPLVSSISKVRLPRPAQENLFVLQRPQIRIARGESIVDADLEALNMWSKLSFAPLSGTKDLQSVALVDEDLNAQAHETLQALAIAYSACNLGSQVPHHPSTGLLLERPVEAVKLRPIQEALHEIASKGGNLVCYIPDDLSTQDLATLVSTLETHSQGQTICLHPVPGLRKNAEKQMTPEVAFGQARAVYDRVRSSIASKGNSGSTGSPTSPHHPAATPQQMMENLQAAQPGTFAPHFTLSPRQYDLATFSLKWPPPSLEVLDRHRFLHVAYTVTPDEQQIALVVCDDRGEMHLTETIPLTTPQEQERVGKVWLYLHALLRKSSVEWRVVVAFISPPKRLTLECWRACLTKTLGESPFACHFSLVELQVDEYQARQPKASELIRTNHRPSVHEALQSSQDEDGLVFRPQSDVLLACNFLTHSPHTISRGISDSMFQSIASAFFYASTGEESASPLPKPVFSVHLLHTAQASSSILHRSLDQHMTDLATSLSDLVHLGRARQFTNSAVPFYAEFLSSCFLGV